MMRTGVKQSFSFLESFVGLWSPQKLNIGRGEYVERCSYGAKIPYEASVEVSKTEKLLYLFPVAGFGPICDSNDLAWIHLDLVRSNDECPGMSFVKITFLTLHE